MMIILCLVAIIVSTLIIWKSSDMIGVSGDNLAYHYSMPSLVKGAVVAAIASSFPELMTVILSTAKHGVFVLGVGTIVGSAVFNILIIPACCQIFTGKNIKASKDIVYKEGFFYVIAIASIVFMFLYSYVFNGDGVEYGTITRYMATVPFVLYIGYLYIQSIEMKETGYDIDDFQPTMYAPMAFMWLVSGMIGVAIGCEVMINAVLYIGDIYAISPLLLGIIVCAAVTSVPDTILSVRDAMKGEYDAALANAFGSNTFDLLVCIPVGIFIAGSSNISILDTVNPMGYLIAITFITLTVIRRKMLLDRQGACLLLFMYVFFVMWQYIQIY